MKVLVIGAGGSTGEQVVGQAVASGHEVTAFVHDDKDFEAPAAVKVVRGDVLDASTVAGAVAGQDAVIDALGGHTPWKATALETNAARNILQAMESNGVKRLLVVSAIGVGDTKDLVPGWYEKLVMPTLLRGVMHDKETMEPAVEGSGLDWTIVRPGHLVDGKRTGQIKTFTPAQGETAHKITRADLAEFLLQILVDGRYVREAVNVASS